MIGHTAILGNDIDNARHSLAILGIKGSRYNL